jgi:uncharacterized protein (TIGR03067 family)
MMKSGMIGLCFLALPLASARDKKGADKFDATKLHGSWSIVEGTKNGEKVPNDKLKGVVKFDKEKITITGEDGMFVMAYTIDASKTPVRIDMKIEKAPFKEAVGSVALGNIAVDGTTLKLCYAEGKQRPKGFESTKENKAHSFVLKKTK